MDSRSAISSVPCRSARRQILRLEPSPLVNRSRRVRPRTPPAGPVVEDYRRLTGERGTIVDMLAMESDPEFEPVRLDAGELRLPDLS